MIETQIVDGDGRPSARRRVTRVVKRGSRARRADGDVERADRGGRARARGEESARGVDDGRVSNEALQRVRLVRWTRQDRAARRRRRCIPSARRDRAASPSVSCTALQIADRGRRRRDAQFARELHRVAQRFSAMRTWCRRSESNKTPASSSAFFRFAARVSRRLASSVRHFVGAGRRGGCRGCASRAAAADAAALGPLADAAVRGFRSGSIACSIASIRPSQSSTFLPLSSVVSRSRAFSRSRRSIAATCSRPRAVGSFQTTRPRSGGR